MDDDEKVRRNLVVVSAVILVSAWLDIPFSALIEKLVGQKYPSPDIFRIWILGFAVMIYTGVRYRFSSEGAQYSSEIQGELQRMREALTYVEVQKQADAYSKTGREPTVFGGKLSEFAETRRAETDNGSELGDWGRPQMQLTVYEHRVDPWSFSMSASFVWLMGDRRMTSTGNSVIDVKIKGFYRWLIELQARLQTWGYSASSIKYLVPVLLSLCAVSTICFKVLQAYLATG
ncbi:MAG TPA: hypothetical protein VIK56_08755 [Rhodoferax sp.]